MFHGVFTSNMSSTILYKEQTELRGDILKLYKDYYSCLKFNESTLIKK